MNSPEVKKLQEWLISIGYKIPDGATGYFGSQTKAAVEQFQQDNKIDTQGNYGYWGPITMGVVNTGNYVYPNKTGYTPSGQQNSDSGTNSGSPSGTDGSSTSGSSADSGTETFNPYYGDTKDQGLEQAANTALRGIFSAGGATGVSSSYVDQVRNNQELVAFYIIAMAYGDYTPSDIIKDMKRRELVASGQKQYEDVTIISGELDRGQYLATNDGSAAMNLPVFKDIKVVFGDLDPSIFDLPIFSPGFDQAFKKLVPILDPDSPEFKAEKDKIKAVFYDVIEQQNNAQLEQQKAVADYTYGRLVDYLQKTYGITLSNNAQEAWKQIEGIGTNYAAANIYGSGLQAEAIDDTLKFRKKADQVIRDKFSSDKEESQYKHYRDNASPEDIKRIIDEDIAKGLPKSQWRATKWGLIPSEEILSKLSVDALMANDPKLTREMAERYRSSIIDENGNYRSNIFQSAFAKNYGLDPNSVYNQRDQYKANKVMEQSLVNEQKAYAPYSSIISQVAGSNTGGSAAIRPAASENSGAAVTDSRNNPSGTSTTQQTYGTTNGTTWINKDQTVGYADKSTADLIKSASGMSANLATPNPTSTTPTTQTPTYTTPNLNYGQTNPTNTNVQYVTANDYAFKPGETLQQWQQRVSNYRIK
jgi:peptidoglycan hydrolase-like protein with peptidoglycan-binding domain